MQGDQGGMWALPTFSNEIPLEIRRADAEVSGLADFLLLAHRKGIKIPDSEFTSIPEVMAAQFSNYASNVVKALKLQLPLSVEIAVTDRKIKLIASADSHLDVFQLKEPVERLNAALPDLGWYVTEMIAYGHSVGLTTYEPSRVADMIGQMWFQEAHTDNEFAAEFLGIEESAVSDEDIEVSRNECTHLPSDALKAFGGHHHLLGWKNTENPVVIRRFKASEVRSKLPHIELSVEDHEVVMAALECDKLFTRGRNDSVAPGGWCAGIEDEESYGVEQIGALAFVVWDNPEMTLEAANHFEEYAMNGEGCHEQMMALTVELDEPSTWPRLLDAYKLYIKRYAAFSKLLGALPRME